MNTDNQTFTQSSDPRLKQIPKEHLQMLYEMAEQLKQAPSNEKLSVFLSIRKQAADAGISFNDQERDLLFSVLTEGMSQDDLKKVQMIRKLSEQIKPQINRRS